MRFCSYCGAKIADGIRFCTECGARIEVPEPVCASPVKEAPAYEPPRQTVYMPPVQPKQEKPKEKKPVSKTGVLIAVIGVLVLIVIGLLIALLAGGRSETTDVVGLYEGVSCKVGGITIGAEEDWIKLQKNGRAKLCIMDSEFSGKWELDGEKLTLQQGGDTYTGTLKNGVISMDLADATYVFAREGALIGPVTYKAVTCISGGQILDEELMGLIGGFYVRFEGDGTGAVYCFGDRIPMTYDKKAMQIDGQSLAYSITGTTMEFNYVDGSGFTLELTQEDPDTVIIEEYDWDDGEQEEQTVESFLPTEMDWLSKRVDSLPLDGMSLSFGAYGYSGTAWLAEDVDGNMVVASLTIFLDDMDYDEVREMLIERYGAPTDEGEEPYVESNGGAVRYSWFEYVAGTLRLSGGSEQDFLQIIMEMAYG